jgi:hypothetical protein
LIHNETAVLARGKQCDRKCIKSMPYSDAVEHSAQFVEESDLLLLDGAIALHPQPQEKPLRLEGRGINRKAT